MNEKMVKCLVCGKERIKEKYPFWNGFQCSKCVNLSMDKKKRLMAD